jgi:thioredoxin 1
MNETVDPLLGRIAGAGMMLVYFSTPQCNVCKVLRPKVEALLEDYPAVEFLYVDSTTHPEASGQHLVFAVPTIVLFMDGREVRRFGRTLAMEDLDRALSLMTGA